MSDVPESVLEIAALVRSKERSVVEVTQDALSRIDALNPPLNAFVALDHPAALARAEALDCRIAEGQDPGPLAGVPLGVKDLEDAAGFRTTFGDPAYAEAQPAKRDSLLVERLVTAGAIVVGKTNTPAYGSRPETENLIFGPTRNPWALDRSPGGSSGGSAAAIAAGMVALGTGSDGGGSLRIPSACTNIAGFKPTYGVVPHADSRPPGWGHLSTRGVMARTFLEIGRALDVATGFSTRDLGSVLIAGSFESAALAANVKGMKIAWSPTLGFADISSEMISVCAAAVQHLEGLGAHVELVEHVFDSDPVMEWLPRAALGALRDLRRAPGPMEERLDPTSRLIYQVGESMGLEDIFRYEEGAWAASAKLADLWDDFDLLACPLTITVPPRVGEPSVAGPGWPALGPVFNLVEAPASSVPAGFIDTSDGPIPVGVQLVGPRLADLRVFQASSALATAVGEINKRPPGY